MNKKELINENEHLLNRLEMSSLALKQTMIAYSKKCGRYETLMLKHKLVVLACALLTIVTITRLIG